MNRKTIIDYEVLAKPIMQIENILSDYDRDEKELIIKNVHRNFINRNQKQQMQDQIANLPLAGLMKRVMKQQED